MKFTDKLTNIQIKNNSLLCIGLDPELEKLPPTLQNTKEPFFEFNKAIIDATFDLVCAYKPNLAFYEAIGLVGLKQLEKTIIYLKKKYPCIPIILDAKRGDIGNTAKMYAQMAFVYFDADALTVNPYLGMDSLQPFLEYKNKFIIVLVKTSNPGSVDFQDEKIGNKPLYLKVAERIKLLNNTEQIGIVAGATFPEQLLELRLLLPNCVFLIPGLGSQGGDLDKTIKYGLDTKSRGIIVNLARTIIYADSSRNFDKKARDEAIKIINEINQRRKNE